jgi:hypothetical protein
VAFRYWLSGPRILGGLVRPGISFYAKDVAALGKSGSRSAVALIFVATRGDGAIMMGRDRTAAAKEADQAAAVTTAAVFAFSSDEAADAVLAGAKIRLSRAAVDARGWLRGVSAGQVAAAIKAEAVGLSYDYAVIRPQSGTPKAVNRGLGWWVGRLVLCMIGIILGLTIAVVITYFIKGTI